MRHRTRGFLVRQQTQLSVAPQVRFQRNAIRAHLAAVWPRACRSAVWPTSSATVSHRGAIGSSPMGDGPNRSNHHRDQDPGAASVPDVSNFKAARDLSASCWKHAFGVTRGLTPQPHSSGGKEKLGKITKMGNRYLRRLLYLGALAQITARSCKSAGETGGNCPRRPHGPHRLGLDKDRRKLCGQGGLKQSSGPAPGSPVMVRCSVRCWQTDGKPKETPRSDRSASQRAPWIGTNSTRTSSWRAASRPQY